MCRIKHGAPKSVWLRTGCALACLSPHNGTFVLHGGRSNYTPDGQLSDRHNATVDDWYQLTLSLGSAQRHSAGWPSTGTLTASALSSEASDCAASKHMLCPLQFEQTGDCTQGAVTIAVLGGDAGQCRPSPLAFVSIDTAAGTVTPVATSAPLPAELRKRTAGSIVGSPVPVQLAGTPCAALLSVAPAGAAVGGVECNVWLAVAASHGPMVCRAGSVAVAAPLRVADTHMPLVHAAGKHKCSVSVLAAMDVQCEEQQLALLHAQACLSDNVQKALQEAQACDRQPCLPQKRSGALSAAPAAKHMRHGPARCMVPLSQLPAGDVAQLPKGCALPPATFQYNCTCSMSTISTSAKSMCVHLVCCTCRGGPSLSQTGTFDGSNKIRTLSFAGNRTKTSTDCLTATHDE